MASDSITSWQIDGKTVETVTDFIFWGSKITADGDCSHEMKRLLLLGRKVMNNLDSILKSRDIFCQERSIYSQSYSFSSSHVWMWESDYKESRAPKNWCFWTVVLEKTLYLFIYFTLQYCIGFAIDQHASTTGVHWDDPEGWYGEGGGRGVQVGEHVYTRGGEDSCGPLDCKEIQPVHPKGNQSWVFIGRTDAEAEIPILWPSDAKNWLIGKDPDAGKDWM